MAISDVFVTVGTTQFETLIATIMSDELLNVLSRKGCRKLVLQVGHGKTIPYKEKCGIQVHSFTLKPNIAEEISKADLVISHAGAGSCLSVLGAGKPLVVVINEDLMDNHQEELASKLEDEGYVFKSNCTNLVDVLEKADFNILKPFVPGNPKTYAHHIDSVMGFVN